jgi:pyruvate/2-oxoglutarate dehydrogenase complex dihydrolipoamide dehydrogenase (E3) component
MRSIGDYRDKKYRSIVEGSKRIKVVQRAGRAERARTKVSISGETLSGEHLLIATGT